ncbi:FHA domain-containing protein [Agromyces bauzanensis]
MATYRPDPAVAWFAAVRGGVVLMTPAAAAGELAALWPELTAADPTSAVLDRLTVGGLAATPSFALVVRDAESGSTRVVVRGEPRVRAGDIEVSGAGVATWAERVVSGDAVEIVVAEVAPDGPDLPVVEGIVPSTSVRSESVEPVAMPGAVAAMPATVATPPAAAAVPATVPAAAVPAAVQTAARPLSQSTIPLPPTPAAAAEQTIVPAEDTVAGPSTPAPFDGDHDGLTVASIDLRRLRAERAARTGATPVPGPPAAVGAEQAPAATLRMPDGALEPLGHEVVLGRAPSVSQVSGGRLPRLITIGAGDPDISRNHVRIAVEGDTVVVTDLHSRNGTHAVAPGKPPVKLRAGEPTPVLAGTVVDLGGGWTVQVVAD